MNQERALSLLQGTASPLPDESDGEWESLALFLEQHPDLDHWFRTLSPESPLLRQAFTAIATPRPAEILKLETTTPSRQPTLFATPRRHFIKAAASLAIGAGAAWWLFDNQRAGPISYASAGTIDDFRQELAEFSAGHYRLDVKGISLDAANHHLHQAGATTPCSLPISIRNMPFIGCKVIEWRGRKVGMTCFHCGEHNVVHIFTVGLDAFSEEPCPVKLAAPKICCELETAGWIANSRLHLAVAAKPGHRISDLLTS
jgi:hypothetical protein